MADQRPKLELELGKAVEMELMYDEPKEGEGEYGKWYAWGVKVGGTAYTYFPSHAIAELMLKEGVKRGTKITVRKTAGERDGKLYHVYDLKIGSRVVMRESQILDSVETGEPLQGKSEPPAKTAPAQPSPLYVCPRLDARLVAEFANCLALEMRDWELPASAILEAAEKLAVTYLIRSLNEGRRIEIVPLVEDDGGYNNDEGDEGERGGGQNEEA